MSSILLLNYSLYLRDLFVRFAYYIKLLKVFPADILYVLTPLIYVILYISTILRLFINLKYYISTRHQLNYKFEQSLQFFIVLRIKQQTMQNSVFYCNKNLISKIDNQEVLDVYHQVTFQQKDLNVVSLNLEVRSHRLLLTSEGSHAFLINGEHIQSIDISESGMFWAKDYSIKLKTTYGKVKLHLKNYSEAKITIQSMLSKKKWTIKQEDLKKKPELYSGMFKKVQKQKQSINSQGQTVNESFSNFEALFGNLRELKTIMASMKSSTGHANGQDGQVNKILKDIGFLTVITKDEAGSNYIRHLAQDLYTICSGTLFNTFGGMVPLLDLFYFYNKKRQIELVSPEELLEACSMFQKLGYKARLITYPNNIKMIQQTTFDPEKDYQKHFSQYFPDYQTGLSAEEIARKRGVPLSIIEIKLRNAAKKGKLAIDDRIEGVRFFKNYFAVI